ncbi:hypothetical protein LJC63_08055 [Ruminococcaceae bacterium OttesenSCG-928-L11]|nr:hypothetical protein [Ruminococcaceae bacterium OttesenSCG-928-L11]
MNACELNAVITAITNSLYSTLSPREFLCLNLFLSELSKSMFSMTLLRDICATEDSPDEKGKKKQ